MTKYKFKTTERFVIWQSYDCKCYFCGEPMEFFDVTIDHLLPENLLDRQEELTKTLNKYGLESNFNINSFENWAPCHQRCNNKKKTKTYIALEEILLNAKNKAGQIRNAYSKLISDRKKSILIVSFLSWIEEKQISFDDISLAFQMLKLPYAVNINNINPKELSYVKDCWRATGLDDRDGMIHVVNGHRSGIVPASSNPCASEWECPRCHEYGPWNGSQCLSCGGFSQNLE